MGEKVNPVYELRIVQPLMLTVIVYQVVKEIDAESLIELL